MVFHLMRGWHPLFALSLEGSNSSIARLIPLH